MDSVMCVASIRDCFTLINVFASDAIPSIAKRTFAALERAVGEAGALCARKAWAGEATICRGKDIEC